jgi:DNA transformation protein
MRSSQKYQINKLQKQLKNVGPKLAEKLVEAGIDTPEKLKKLGAKTAFLKMYEHGDKYGDYNAAYLYALEGAIRDCNWLYIPDQLKTEYKKYAQSLQKNKKLG